MRIQCNFYHPQTKFAKVTFSQASVCPQWGGVSAPLHARIHPLQEQTPPRGSRHPPEQTPPAVHAGRYGQRAGGTHPTGMHTCRLYFQTRAVSPLVLYGKKFGWMRRQVSVLAIDTGTRSLS